MSEVKVDPSYSISTWGKEKAREAGVNPLAATYDSDMLHLIFDEPFPYNLQLKFIRLCKESGFIKFPYVITALDESEDLAEEGEFVYTLSFFNLEG